MALAAPDTLPTVHTPVEATYVPWLVAAGALTAALGIASLFTKKYAVIALSAAGFLATQLAIIGHGTISERFTAAALVASIEPKPGVPPTAAWLGTLVGKLTTTPAKLIMLNAYNDPKAANWLGDRVHTPAVVLPFSVGGSEERRQIG